jgi:hypothetical protein
MNKKIGIITISRTSNYGAELQAYALQKKLNVLGYDTELIDYLYFKHSKHKPTKASRPDIFFSKKQRLKNFLTYRIISPFIDTIGSLLYPPVKRRSSNFKNFHEQGGTKYSKQYRSYVELKKAKLNYDVFIVGSDQVWNPGTATSLSPYFLEFAPKNKLKMTYASSFGVSEIPTKYHPLYEKYFNTIDHIAVREQQGVALVKEVSEKKAIQVLDPTLLLSKEDWSTVASKKTNLPKGKYILIYKLHESDTLIHHALQLKKQLNCEVYNICKRAFSNTSHEGINNLVDAGPSEYISLFKNAAFVFTTSFHGTAFSVNFNIPFYSVLKPKKLNNSRITGFLEKFDLSNRIIWEGDTKSTLNTTVDFDFANRKLVEEKISSIAYLESTIKLNLNK